MGRSIYPLRPLPQALAERWRAARPGRRPGNPRPSWAQRGSRPAPERPSPPGDPGGGRRPPEGWRSAPLLAAGVGAGALQSVGSPASEHLERGGCAAGGCKSRSGPRGAVVYSRVRIAVRVCVWARRIVGALRKNLRRPILRDYVVEIFQTGLVYMAIPVD